MRADQVINIQLVEFQSSPNSRSDRNAIPKNQAMALIPVVELGLVSVDSFTYLPHQLWHIPLNYCSALFVPLAGSAIFILEQKEH
ncbi:hypothetical protein ACE1CB_26550 [Aerosakkonema sp. BLCC-F2]